MNDLYPHAPHMPAAAAGQHSPHAALLIDFDNVTMGIRSNLGQELSKLLDSDIIRGKVSVQRAYADWRRYPQYIASLSEASIDLIFAPAYGSTKKNATDIRLAIDALEIVFIRPEIGTFILLSGDSDFSSLVLKLKEYGKYVIGVGIQESSSDLLVQNCDEYYSYSSLSGLTAAADMQNIEKHDPWELAAKSIRRMTERSDVMRSDRFKQVMLELDPSFSEKSIGFNKFNRFLTEAASRGIIVLHKAANGQYAVEPGSRAGDFIDGGAVRPAGESPAAQAPGGDDGRKRVRRKDEEETTPSGGRRGRRSPRRDRGPVTEAPPEVDEDRLREAYDLLRSVVEARAAGGRSVRDSEVKRHMLEKEPDFDEAALGFRKFSRFLKQAHDEEVIDLERTGEGNYRIGAVHGSKAAEAAPERKREPDRKKGRRDRRERGRHEDERDDRDRKTEPAKSEQESPPAPEPGAEAMPAPGPEAEEPADDARRAERRPTGLVGRSRRTSHPTPGTKIVPGPVDEVPAGSRKSEPHGGKEGPAEARAKPQSRSTGRFRRGSRGVRDTTPAAAGQVRSEEPDARSGKLTPDQVTLVDRMARTYQGVGRRTAERLVSMFGNDVLRVIDHEPGRVEEALPKGRARAVLDGRRAELESDDAS
jgi:uncharacterized protein (TIGR00288 family)